MIFSFLRSSSFALAFLFVERSIDPRLKGELNYSRQRARGPGAWRRFEGSDAGACYCVLRGFTLRAIVALELCSKLMLPEWESRLVSVGFRVG